MTTINTARYASLLKTAEGLGYLNSPEYLKQCGYTKREVETAVKHGFLEWRRDGNLNITARGESLLRRDAA